MTLRVFTFYRTVVKKFAAEVLNAALLADARNNEGASMDWLAWHARIYMYATVFNSLITVSQCVHVCACIGMPFYMQISGAEYRL